MKVYTFFTPSHKLFLKTYMDSFPFEDGFDLQVKFFPQECPTAKYREKGWKQTMKRKIEYILESLEETKENDCFIHSDIDIQFFKPFKSDILKELYESEKEILFQNDFVALCMGFFICKKTKNTTNFFNLVNNQLDDFVDDQVAVNSIIKNHEIKYGVLSEKYYTIGPKNGIWTGNTNIEIPKNLILHHANWTEGLVNKMMLLQLVKSRQ